MKNLLTKTVLVLAACMIWLSGIALPLDKKGSGTGIPKNDPITVGNNSYSYTFTTSDIGDKPASKVIPPKFSDGSWSVGEGVTGYVADQFKTKWASDAFTKNRIPVTPVVCIDMGEHYFIAQFYEGAPGQYGALVVGQDGYVYNTYSMYCEFLSAIEWKCWGLPVGDTKKELLEKKKCYTIEVQTDPCYGGNVRKLFFAYTSLANVTEESLYEAGSCGMGPIYTKEEPKEK